MLTPQEVAQRSFGKASFNGYNMAMVDDFLDEVTADYEALFNENALLKQKLGVLSNKIREYQSTEEAMRKTLLAAQEMSDKMVKETEEACAAKLAEAETRAAAIERELAGSFRGEQAQLEAARASVEKYKAQVRAACEKQLALLDQLEQIAVPTVVESGRREAMDQKVEDIQAAVERSLAQEAQELSRAGGELPALDLSDAPAAVQPPEESSVSLYEQLVAQRRERESTPTDESAATRRFDDLKDYFGKDREED